MTTAERPSETISRLFHLDADSTRDALGDVRLRHRIHARRIEGSDMVGWAAHRDRGILLAEVDILLAEVDRLRAEMDDLEAELSERSAAYDEVCRYVGRSIEVGAVSDTELDLNAIRERHAETERWGDTSSAHVDRGDPLAEVDRMLVEAGALLAEVDRRIAERAEARSDIEALEDLLHTFWLHTSERHAAVRDMTTRQKDRYADAVEATSKRLNADSTCDCGCGDGVSMTRWWRQ